MLRLLTRSATNAFFPQVATVISLPEAEDALGRIVAAHLTDLREAGSPAEIGLARKFNQSLKAALQAYSDEAVFARVKQLEAGGVAATAPDPRVAEYEVLASGQALIGEDRSDALLHAATLPRSAWDPDDAPLLSGIHSLVAVHRLREVVCLYGFTRFESSPPMGDDGLEDVGLAVRGAALGSSPEWLPAIEQYGEGLSLQLDPEAINQWLAREETSQHVRRLMTGFELWRAGKVGLKPRSAPYALLHSLSHALMTEIALDCGYPASALRERVYALPPRNPERAAPMRSAYLHRDRRHAGNAGRLGRGDAAFLDGAARRARAAGGLQQRSRLC